MVEMLIMLKKNIKLVIEEDKWKAFEEKAVAKFGIYGAVSRGVKEAIVSWVEEESR